MTNFDENHKIDDLVDSHEISSVEVALKLLSIIISRMPLRHFANQPQYVDAFLQLSIRL